MPLRPESKKKLNTSDEDKPKNSSFDSCYETMDDMGVRDPLEEKEEDEEDDQFLTQLGFENDIIKNINIMQVRGMFKY